ncbi:MAG: hypothetical protein GF416_08300 [Candidatus Altiarchaeales archaeon]|nr:hypothetical protein [Candidatus Altiarchaeales archaeon]MBD3417116.1 hypothetical protein [Candidatus Altiarchaeales archaeon]
MTSDSNDDGIDRALDYAEKGELNRARGEYIRAVKEDPGKQGLYYMMSPAGGGFEKAGKPTRRRVGRRKGLSPTSGVAAITIVVLLVYYFAFMPGELRSGGLTAAQSNEKNRSEDAQPSGGSQIDSDDPGLKVVVRDGITVPVGGGRDANSTDSDPQQPITSEKRDMLDETVERVNTGMTGFVIFAVILVMLILIIADVMKVYWSTRGTEKDR